MKKLLILMVLVALGAGAYYKFANQSSAPAGPSVHIGASVKEVEAVFGQPLAVLPQFGRELRTYKAAS